MPLTEFEPTIPTTKTPVDLRLRPHDHRDRLN